MSISALCVLLTLAAAPGDVVVDLDFEQPGQGYALHMGGELTGDAAEPIDGDHALLGDSRGKMRKWYEFFTTDAGPITPGYTYKVSFQYRVDAAEPDAFLYGLFRSKGEGWGKYDRGWTNFENLADHVGEVRTATLQVGLDNLDDYELMLGIHGNADVVIDNLTITRGEKYHEPSEAEKLEAELKEQSELIHHFDFDQAPANARLHEGVSLTTDPDLALGDNASLYADTTGKGQWHEVMWLPDLWKVGKDKVVLEPGYAYDILFDYHVIDAVDDNAFGYTLARSHEHGHGSYDRGWGQFSFADGKTGTMHNHIEILEGDDYFFILGISRQARVVFDDLKIYRRPVDKRPIETRRPMTPTDDTLVWREEFNDGRIDTARWNVSGPFPRRGGWWLPEMVSVNDDGHFVMTFDKYKDTYAMGAINTQGKFEFTYGYVEARMKLPTEQGHWPGVWLFSSRVNNVGNAGRDGTEVDIVEAPWRNQDRVSHALHWDGYGSDHKQTGHHVDIDGINQGWHTYAVEWSPDGYVFFVDGRETWRSAAGGVCENPLHIILSDELGGWSGNPDHAKDLPDHTYIDYVRVWQTDEWREADAKRRAAAE